MDHEHIGAPQLIELMAGIRCPVNMLIDVSVDSLVFALCTCDEQWRRRAKTGLTAITWVTPFVSCAILSTSHKFSELVSVSAKWGFKKCTCHNFCFQESWTRHTSLSSPLHTTGNSTQYIKSKQNNV